MVNCKKLQPVVQLLKLCINAREDVEWLPTNQVEPIQTDSEDDNISDNLDDDQVSVISISSDSTAGSVISMSCISISEVEPFISSDSENTLVGSDFENDDSTDSDTDTSSEIDLEPESDIMPNNATKIIDEFNQFRTLPEVLNTIILYPQSRQNFKFLNQIEPSIYTWSHQCNCKYPSEQDNIMKFYFENMMCPQFRPKYLMYYQPTMWVENASASLLHFLMRSQSLAKFINKLHFEMMNNPHVDFGVFLFKIAENRHSDTCTYILTVKTEVCIRGNHLINTHDLDITDVSQVAFDHWLHQYEHQQLFRNGEPKLKQLHTKESTKLSIVSNSILHCVHVL